MTTTTYSGHAAVGVRPFFPLGHYSAAQSRLGARGKVTRTCYRVRTAVGVRHLFLIVALIFFPVASWYTRNDDNDNLPRTRGGGCSSPFSVEALLCSAVASWCTRNDDNDNLPRTLSGGCSSLFSVEAILWCPVASCCTRNDDNDILPQPLGGGCS
ncbi:hypothetical protein TNCV_4587471 [Trichonephila clavipes]|uniref:Transmembrane protein n=1 Tax=Trichonephila clavipes TaxID=2585209 RepID=A0A8X6RYQ5_TRICX|nr:hypothetical protein TNCV_4587471 [Trichonephila clavipes]